jgi:uncharacterized OsmC-like protein
MAPDKFVNGINVDQLFRTIEQIKGEPELGKSKFRANNKWLDGTHGQARVHGFYTAGKEDTSRKPVTFEIDEPTALMGKGEGTNPVEYLLVALSGCLTTSLVAHAAAKGIEIREVESRLEGDIDLRGFLGISEEVKVGYQQIRVIFHIDADISPQQKQELIEMAQKYSPVFNTIFHATPVAVQLEKEEEPEFA